MAHKLQACYEQKDGDDSRGPPQVLAAMKQYHLVFAMAKFSMVPVQQAKRGRSGTPQDGAERTARAPQSSEAQAVNSQEQKSKTAGMIRGPDWQAKAAYSPGPSAAPWPS